MPDTYDDRTHMPFGKFGPFNIDHRALEDVPSDYLEWLMDETWTYEKHPELMNEVEEIYEARGHADHPTGHWNEADEEIDSFL